MGKESKIDWCDSSWNPIVGCLRGCKYCYARGIANRFGNQLPDHSAYHAENYPLHILDSRIDGNPYPWLFEPTFHAYRLDEPKQWTKPRTIFVGSMSDVFGDWVPADWINDVFDACRTAPQHRYLFLTKNPKRYELIKANGWLPKDDNFWYGSTMTDPEMPCFTSDEHNTFISVEPVLKPFGMTANRMAENHDWIIIGPETGNRNEKVIPQRRWISDFVQACEQNNTPLFMKEKTRAIWCRDGEKLIQRYPWGGKTWE